MDAQHFKAARAALGLTQTEWGRMLGVSKRTVIYLETGEKPVTATMALLVRAIELGFRP